MVHISNEGEQSVSYYQDYFYVANFIFLIVMLLIISKILKSTDIAYFYQLKDDNDKFKNASETDDLTGLINKRTLNLIIDNKRRSSMVISMCDIDNFKQINDQFGHNTGDLVLKTLSNIFLDHTNKTDIVCRWGGEEFVIVSFDISKNDFLTKIQKIKFQISETIIKEGNETFNFSVTFGVSEVGNDRNLLIKQADERLYKGKNSTKNCIVSK
ncbi:GGDEF domain-containing protein [Campylobacter fetus]|uniref:GGDEF domain-containing protein n=1 Tax=Campylobacter fetus TaxID=196 RepID=UPI00166ADD37|nr:GGDEF domain-containing protein [Campylobacter fetus]EKR7992369.1 GGDEF domain-containing protein [Campylobacter fetus]HDX6315035.1 GGDEF domain-containing protein [Campylobacter fetus subsp. venerealis]HDX6328592.1 GGDEF domain-containing protein [Campylobacter fetus]